MKKSVLFILAAGISFGAMAQNTPAPTRNTKCIALRPYLNMQQAHRNDQPAGQSQNSGQQPNRHRVQASRIPLGSSYNAYGVLDASTTALTANKACHLIAMTHREDASKAGCGSGAYEVSYSTNMGYSWDSTIVMLCNQPSRYPNGVIFNPAGNTNPLNCYNAFAGPWTNSAPSPADSWVATVHGSVKLDNTMLDNAVWMNGVNGHQIQNTGDLSYMQSCDDSTVHVIGQGFNVNNSSGFFTRWLGAVITTGKFATDSFNWTQTVIKPHFWSAYKGALANAPIDSGNGAGSPCQHIGTPGMAWSQNGATGYVVFLGNLDSAGLDFVSYQPIVYKTTDHGQTWNMMTPFNFRTLPNLVQYLVSSGQVTSDSGYALPLINVIGSQQGSENDYDMTVDANNNLHIFCSVQGMYYGNPDSAYNIYTYNKAKYYLYDLHTTSPTGGWQARFIDSMNVKPSVMVNDGTWSSGTASVSFGARIQASRTTDGTHLFCIWEDDITGDTAIISPDIFGQAFDVTNNATSTVQQFTNTADQYFLCVSNIALDSGSGCPGMRYTIPCVYAEPQNIPNDGTAPINFFYQNSVRFVCDSNFTEGVDNVSSNGFSVSPNYPNPFNKTTEFNVTLPQASMVSVDVFNMLGQKVWSMMPGKMGAGVNVVSINAASLSAGIYFYRVTVNQNSITQKMVVQ